MIFKTKVCYVIYVKITLPLIYYFENIDIPFVRKGAIVLASGRLNDSCGYNYDPICTLRIENNNICYILINKIVPAVSMSSSG